MITREEILMNREVEFPLDEKLEANLAKLLIAVNKFRTIYGIPMSVSSGYRPGKYNKAAGGSLKSSHLTCEAVDFKDVDGKIKLFCLQNIKVLEECGLYMEDPANTITWAHLQVRPTKNRIFKP